MTQYIKDISLPDLFKEDSIALDEIEEAASLFFRRKGRWVDGYDFRENLKEVCIKFFGDTNINQKYGLISQYKKMKEYVVENKLIGLFLLGINLKDILIDTYPTVDNNIIDLTVDSISRVFLKEHFTQDEIHWMCQTTPNFDKYYDHILEKKKTELN